MEQIVDEESVSKVIQTTTEQTNKVGKPNFKQMKVNMNCPSLNVRKEPSLNSDILCELSKGTVLNINLEKSTFDFYYVASKIIDSETKIPIHGYCIKVCISEV